MGWDCLWATARRNFIIKIRAYPMDFFIGSLLTCLYSVLGAFFIFKIVYGGSISEKFVSYTSTGDYMSYIILGSAIYLFVVETFLNVSRSFITEMREGTLDSLLITPMNVYAYLAGNMLQQIITTSGETLAAVLISLPFGLNLSRVNLPGMLLCLVISLFAFFGMAVILAGVMVSLRDTYISQNTVFMLLILLCGFSFPIQYLPPWVQVVSKCIPVTYSLRIFRASALLGSSIQSQAGDFGMLALLGAAYCIIGLWLVKKIVKAAPGRQFI